MKEPGIPVRSDPYDSRLSYAVVRVSGEVDTSTAPALGTALTNVLAGGRVKAVADLSAVTFLNSSGLGALMRAHKAFNGSGGQLRLVVSNRPVRMPLEVTRLIDAFAVYDSLELAEADWLGTDLTTAGLASPK